jgi:hypothetical protein
MKRALTIILALCLGSCLNESGPAPQVSILTPGNGELVSEILAIHFELDHDTNIDQHELIVDGQATGLIVQTEPYIFYWNTTLEQNNTIHILLIRTTMDDGKRFDSEPVNVIVDHEGYYPATVALHPAQPDGDAYMLLWQQSPDLDFGHYELLESTTPEMQDAVLIYETEQVQDTSFSITDQTMDGNRYYQLIVKDAAGLSSTSNVMDNFLRFASVVENSSAKWGGAMKRSGDLFYGLATGFDGTNSIMELNLFDQFGALISQQTYSASGHASGASLIPLPNSDVLLFGSHVGLSGNGDLRAVRISSLGNQIWDQNYNALCHESPLDIVQASDGTILMSGTSRTCTGDESSNIVVMRISDTGERLSTHLYEKNGWQGSKGLVATAENGFVLVAGDINRRVWVSERDSDGELIWSTSLGDGMEVKLKKIIMTMDGGYLLVGDRDGYDLTTTGGVQIKLSSNGANMWSSSSGDCLNCTVLDVKEQPDGDFIMVGYKNGNDGWLIKTDPSGGMLWERVFSGDNPDKLTQVELAEDGGYYLHGFTTSGLERTWFIKTDPDGRSVFSN